MKLKRHGTKTITAIVPMHDEVARGTLKSILEQAGIELEKTGKLWSGIQIYCSVSAG